MRSAIRWSLAAFASLLLASLLLGSCVSCASHRHDHRTEVSLSSLDPRIEAAWRQATTLAAAPSSYRQIPNVIWVKGVCIDTDGRRLYGKYMTWVDLDSRTGKFYVVEQIMIYLLPEEEASKMQKVLTHEFLHACWQRRQMDPTWRDAHPDSETFVCGLGMCD